MTKIHTIITEKTQTDDLLEAYKELNNKLNKIDKNFYYAVYMEKEYFYLNLSHEMLSPMRIIKTKSIKSLIRAIIKEQNTVNLDIILSRFGTTSYNMLYTTLPESSESIEEETSEET